MRARWQTQYLLIATPPVRSLLQLDESILDATETLTKMRALFDNYEMDAAVNEHVSPIERKEENEFLNAVLATSVMRTAMKFLQDKGNMVRAFDQHRCVR